MVAHRIFGNSCASSHKKGKTGKTNFNVFVNKYFYAVIKKRKSVLSYQYCIHYTIIIPLIRRTEIFIVMVIIF